MSKNIIDRLFETNYFSAISEALEKYNLSENSKHLKKLMSDKADIKLVNARFNLQEFYTQMFNEAFEHLNKINDIFNLINKSLFSDVKKEKLKNTVIDIIDEKFTDFAGVKFRSINELSNYSYGYRRGLLDNLYNIINSLKENQYFKITDEIYKNLSHDKLIKGKTVFTRLIIDNNLSNEHDIVKINEHIKNKIDEINNLKTCIYGENLQSFKSGLSDKKLEKLHTKLISAGYIATETDLEAFTKVFSAEPINNIIVPVKWIKKASKNKLTLKKALIELLCLLNIPKSEVEDKTRLRYCFADGDNQPLIFTGSNYYNNKGIKNSEFYSEIQTIVKSL
jgi:hypothetical protein